MVIETIEKEDNENIRNRIKLPIEEWQKDFNQTGREKHHAKDEATAGRDNRITG